MEQIDDDPRYFDGAELGKAQKAALGIQGLNGRNTASFDPRSTLVRPAMRVCYRAAGTQCEQELKPDDVIIVPDFYCKEGALEPFGRLQAELRTLQREDTRRQHDEDLGTLPPLCRQAAEQLCRRFAIGVDHRAVRISWHRGPSDGSPFVHTVGSYGPHLAKRQNCLVTLSFGAAHELALRRSGSEELLFFVQLNGAASFFGRDVCGRWHMGPNADSVPFAALGGSTPRGRAEQDSGYISIMVAGRTEAAVKELSLAAGPGDERLGGAGFEGRLDGGCRDVARPAMRVLAVQPHSRRYPLPVRHDDVIVVPEFFCKENDHELYYKLVQEMRESQAAGTQRAEWISWHEGAHLLSQNPTGSRTYQKVLSRICEYFSIADRNQGTRFNWYKDGSDWKPFHHDSAAFNEKRAKTQNCTIGISFGAARELAFRHAKTGELIYFPQTNGMLYFFGRDANIVWQHGVNALPDDEQDGKGRISIIIWGLCTTAVDEAGSPPMLTDDSRGGKGGGKGGYDGRRNQPCRDFQRGRCSYGDRCRFSHELVGAGRD